ncbi:GSCFA domain-containing protein [Ramlibacter terrae]|uniref:GSCFA domain-containing protein n=1 Tax=Ramlibacter terrae TaxID=2732511 RepID=A0ABX6P261_9BURK|nr:GSCFA domain-containing protein [Ramlibacter terrae]
MNPYEQLDEKAFWALAVARAGGATTDGIWKPKFGITPTTRVVTYGSCFAQHIGRSLAERGYRWLNTEPAPPGLSAENARKYNYGIFSGRTGNIYTVSLLLQWVRWALGDATPPDEIWEQDGRFHDPFRPRIEPGGFASREELEGSRAMALEAFRLALSKAGVMVFTLGLTESWFHRQAGHEYPMCPGTAAGTFDPQLHGFVNQDYPFIRQSLVEAIARIRAHNRKMRFLLTVSPVPLTATMSGQHVVVATTESKSILRAVAGSVAREHAYVDYFPSYEIITAPAFGASFFEANQRTVTRAGVDRVMRAFFAAMDGEAAAGGEAPRAAAVPPGEAEDWSAKRRSGRVRRRVPCRKAGWRVKLCIRVTATPAACAAGGTGRRRTRGASIGLLRLARQWPGRTGGRRRRAGPGHGQGGARYRVHQRRVAGRAAGRL